MNKNVKIANELIMIAKSLLSSPHHLNPSDVIRLNGKYVNLTDSFTATISSTDSREINNESREDMRKEGIPEQIIIEVLNSLREIFRNAVFSNFK